MRSLHISYSSIWVRQLIISNIFRYLVVTDTIPNVGTVIMIKSVFYEQNLICLPIKIKSDCKYVRVKTLLLLYLCGCTDTALQSRGRV